MCISIGSANWDPMRFLVHLNCVPWWDVSSIHILSQTVNYTQLNKSKGVSCLLTVAVVMHFLFNLTFTSLIFFPFFLQRGAKNHPSGGCLWWRAKQFLKSAAHFSSARIIFLVIVSLEIEGGVCWLKLLVRRVISSLGGTINKDSNWESLWDKLDNRMDLSNRNEMRFNGTY